jgi:hypothetical protein
MDSNDLSAVFRRSFLPLGKRLISSELGHHPSHVG